jgi:hypothetical protein
MMETIDTLESVIESESKAIPQLCGISEFARSLGWYKQKVHTYAARGLLPQPITHIGNRPIWTRTQVYKFAIEKGLPYYEQPFEPHEK